MLGEFIFFFLPFSLFIQQKHTTVISACSCKLTTTHLNLTRYVILNSIFSVHGGCLHYAKRTKKDGYVPIGFVNLREQKCIITREEGRKISIFVGGGTKVFTTKSVSKISGKYGQSTSFRKLRKNNLGSHRELVFRAPSEGIADLWCAWMKSAAMCGKGGEKNVAVIQGRKSVDNLMGEDWHLFARLPGMVVGRASANRLQDFQEDLTRIATQNQRQIEEIRQSLDIDWINIALEHDSSDEEDEEMGDQDDKKMNYPISPISFETETVQNVPCDGKSDSSSGYDCDSGEESSLVAL